MDGNFPAPVDVNGQADAAFQAEVDAFLDTELTEELRAAGRETTGLKSPRWACDAWRKRLNARGWFAPCWPVEHGGAGWSAEQRLYFENACAERDAPIVMNSGVRTIGPLIIADGTEAQKARYLPAILNGEHEWCQGFSEPQAGSDLSALSLRAHLQGDEFVLNGSKIWTSFAHYATHMFVLARCEAGSTGRDGLVFLLVEMNRPGIRVRPIHFISGERETCEVFFDTVRTPASDRIGEIGDGWAAAKALMAIARSNNTTTGLLRRALRAARRGMVGAPPSRDLTILTMKVDAFETLEARASSGEVAVSAAARSSVLKVLATELHQAITEAGLTLAPNSDFAQAKYLSTRAATIYSGTSEVHRNILAHAIGCP